MSSRLIRGVEALLLLGVALWAWRFILTLPDRLPSSGDYAALSAVLAREAKPGDVLLLHPWWAEKARLFAPAQLPVVGYLGSDGDDLEEYQRIWVLSQPELPRNDEHGFQVAFSRDRVSELNPQRFGNLRLERFRNGRYHPPLLSSDDGVVQPAALTVETGQDRAVCTGSGGQVSCPGGAFAKGTAWHEVHYRPLRCLWIHPPPAPSLLTLTLPVDSAAAQVRVEAGLFWEHAAKRDPKLTPVTLSLEGATSPAEIRIEPGDERLQRIERPLPSAGAQGLTVRVETRNPEAREICLRWRLYGRPPLPGALR